MGSKKNATKSQNTFKVDMTNMSDSHILSLFLDYLTLSMLNKNPEITPKEISSHIIRTVIHPYFPK